ncbi:MAG: hypothetical protein A3A32_03670 [Candidatus Wildermuthbacteria bacterium RIFCSPLOWO2_01_FULL_48_35]|uniref:Response regulatory domain-containing protein n=2 Tax=Parcubacteria group TaxID=1794811 RepID=A0A1G2RRE2_9BACT|nr:MAG: hypothetical protein A2633_00805 [Candidatus Sungbacteria bacterium RIFCSPHIGHO2_01_FULL_47_32]OHA74919.1 MAG: hypothetical protein A3A32_03670 [Candidatus Wildermuthbacteria bacterium RIFCSPLOWO2_01_FULL_48_35]
MAKILIIEDEALLRGSLTAEFKRAGFDVSEAKDGWEGLQMARREHLDILLLDIILPKIQGLDVLKLLRGDPMGKNCPGCCLNESWRRRHRIPGRCFWSIFYSCKKRLDSGGSS